MRLVVHYSCNAIWIAIDWRASIPQKTETQHAKIVIVQLPLQGCWDKGMKTIPKMRLTTPAIAISVIIDKVCQQDKCQCSCSQQGA